MFRSTVSSQIIGPPCCRHSGRQANLAALDTQIDPPSGLHAFEASACAERVAQISPPTEAIDRVTTDLVQAFNGKAHAGSVAPEIVAPLLAPFVAHYQALVEPVWDLIERCVERERSLVEAPSVHRRFEQDRDAFGRHVDWVTNDGRYRTTDTSRQAAMTLRRLEEAQDRYEAEHAIEDPACMVSYLLDSDTFEGGWLESTRLTPRW